MENTETSSPGSDKRIGEEVAEARGVLTQKELAARMKQEGWRWSQTTVWSVESGERPLRLSEAVSVSEITGYPLSWIAGAVVDDDAREELARLRKFKETIDAAYKEGS